MEKKPKEKRRNSERRKEKSRDAARSRRSKETEIFTDLGTALPLPKTIINQLDKATVMRLTIASFKIVDALSSMHIDNKINEKEEPKHLSEICNKALDGIVLITTSDGDIVFVSENVSNYLGLSQIDLIGQSVYEFAHLCDQSELKEMLTAKDIGVQKSFFIRMKCTLTNKGRNVNLKSASYKVLHFTGHSLINSSAKRKAILSEEDSDSDYESDKKIDSDTKINHEYLKHESLVRNEVSQIFVSIAEPIPHPSNIEIPLYKQSKIFFSKHSLDMKYLIADDVITKYLGYEPQSLISKSIFDYYHAQDCNSIEKSFKILFQKGQVETNKFRFLAKGGGYVWIVTQATILNDHKGQKPESVMCINYIVSEVENRDEIYSLCQVPQQTTTSVIASNVTAVKPPISIVPEKPQKLVVKKSCTEKLFKPKCLVDSSTFLLPAGDGPVSLDPKEFLPIVLPIPNKKKAVSFSDSPKATTAKIFVPRTEDMNKGFLTFSDDDTGLTILKDEPEDLTHLAPTAGDVCVPLDTCGLNSLGFVVSDVLDDLILTDCSLAPFDSMSQNSLHDSYSNRSSSPMQQFSDEMSQSPGLYDPTTCALLGMDLDSNQSDLDLDLSLKNQFIPMYEDDLYPLLSGDLWGITERSPSPNSGPANWHTPETIKSQEKKDIASPSLAKLLKTEANSARPHFDSGGMIDGGGDSWGSISKMLHQRYNSSSTDSRDDVDKRSTNGVKRVGPNVNATTQSWKRCKQEETAKQGTSSSVLMNLLGVTKLVGKDVVVKNCTQPRHRSRLKSAYLLDPSSTAIPSLLDLTEQDYDVNAPAGGELLQGSELLKALEIGNITT
ncbi:hypoxia-inducible factor 1-alpha-like isoform X2 [Daktulosphaira vitifoliae]|uniref:hypoxia-inducible factor 1-alpha-like isoform X2 n=1 Tax=Daktulosphaira vitifoliae TaxID=58002 RepID=UPI0021AA116F|nr:hypoxia-inducible factor 1-alpha-like isoform X2 [Daktulosphaira vitifoliae]